MAALRLQTSRAMYVHVYDVSPHSVVGQNQGDCRLRPKGKQDASRTWVDWENFRTEEEGE